MTLPYQKHSETSRQAAEENTTAATLREKIFQMIKDSGQHGMIADEVRQRINKSSNSTIPRLVELNRAGRIVKLQETRKTRSNRNANVYVVPELVGDRDIEPPKSGDFYRDNGYEIYSAMVGLYKAVNRAAPSHVLVSAMRDIENLMERERRQ